MTKGGALVEASQAGELITRHRACDTPLPTLPRKGGGEDEDEATGLRPTEPPRSPYARNDPTWRASFSSVW